MFVVQIVALVRADDAERRNRHATAHQALSRALLGTLLVIVGCAVLGPVLTSAPFAHFFATKTFMLVRLYVIVPTIALALVVAFAYVNSVFQRRLTMIRLWLGVVVLATFFQLVLSTEYAGGHFSVGWVAVLAFWLVASALFLTMMVVNVTRHADRARTPQRRPVRKIDHPTNCRACSTGADSISVSRSSSAGLRAPTNRSPCS